MASFTIFNAQQLKHKYSPRNSYKVAELPETILFVLTFICTISESCSREYVYFNMNQQTIKNMQQDIVNSVLQDCESSNTNLKTIALAQQQPCTLQKEVPPNNLVCFEYEITSSGSTGSLLISLNKIAAIPIDVRFAFNIIGEEACFRSASSSYSFDQFFRGQVCGSELHKVLVSFQFEDNVIFALTSLVLYARLCHPSCLECLGTNINQCTRCSEGSLSLKGGCSCTDQDKVLEAGVCVDSCSDQHFQVNKSCFFIENCMNADSDGNCTACNNSMVVSNNECLTECPHWQSLSSDGRTCSDSLIQMPYETHFIDFYQSFFSQQTILESQVTLMTANNQLITASRCNNISLVSGQFTGVKDSVIYFPVLKTQHKYALFSFKYVIIDLKDKTQLKIVISLNGVWDLINQSSKFTTESLCGEPINDAVGVYQGIIDFTTSSNAENDITIQIENTSDDSGIYFGIRDVVIFGFSCWEFCATCKVDHCTTCLPGYLLQNNLKCVECPNDKLAADGSCEGCHGDCLTCSGTLNTNCKSCVGMKQLFQGTCLECSVGSYSYIDGFGKQCGQCDQSCMQCQNNKSECISCVSNRFLRNKQCLECNDANSLFLNSNSVCQACDTTCKTCFGTSNNQCKTCAEGFYLKSDKTCQPCLIQSCSVCENNGVCTKCKGGNKLLDNTCQLCSVNSGYYISGENCFKCDPVCATCTGPKSDECTQCANIDDYYKLTFTPLCKYCPIAQENNQSIGKCTLCSTECKTCKEVNASKAATFNDSDFCQYCFCTKCSDNSPIFRGTCVSSCNGLGEGIILNTQTNQCECKPELSVLITLNGSHACANGLPFGYFCPQQSACTECEQFCETCTSLHVCGYCLSGYYRWQDKCIDECFPSLSILANDSLRICECESGKLLKKRDSEDKANSYPDQEYICLNPLKLDTIEVINALSKPSSREGIPQVILNNYFVLTYNRRPTQEEFKTFSFIVMQGVFQKDVDYKLIAVNLETGKSSVLIEVEMIKNRKIAHINVVLDTLNDRVVLSNVVLISPELAESIGQDTTSKSMSDSMESLTNMLVNSDSSFLSEFSKYSKEFQIVCMLSNFVQLLAPIYFLNAALPPLIKFGSLLGASFIFTQLPSSQQVEYSQESYTKRRLLSGSTDNNNNISTMLAGFGMKGDILSSFIGVHILVFASVGLIAFCYAGRRAFKGKQYTIALANKISNFVTSQLQSSLTVILAMLAYCFITGEGVALASFYLVMYAVIFVNIAYLTFSKSEEYLHENLPNFFEDINHKAKGAKSYLLVSFLKKHLAIIFLITLYTHPKTCCTLIAILYIGQACIFGYLRFFRYSFICAAKIIQELTISLLFIVLTLTLNKYEAVTESEDIVDGEVLTDSITWANIVLILMIACVFISFLFSTYRLVTSIRDLCDAWRKYNNNSNVQNIDVKSLDDTQVMHQTALIQMQEGLTTALQVKPSYQSQIFQSQLRNMEAKKIE